MTKLIINSDDFGYSRGMNYAILDTHQLGVLTSATLMPNMFGFEQAVEMAKQCPKLGVGIHLVLTCQKPLLNTHKHLTREDGIFYHVSEYSAGKIELTPEWASEVEAEWEAQIQKVLACGIKPTHFDSHHHMHLFSEQTRAIVFKLAEKYGVPVRAFDETQKFFPPTINHPNYFVIDFDEAVSNLAKDETKLNEYFTNLINKVKEYDVVEIMVHPGYIDSAILNGSSWNTMRIPVNDALLASKFVELIRNDKEIELATYAVL